MLFIFTEEIIHIMSIVLKALMVKKYTVFISRVLRSTIQVLTKSSKCLFEYTQKGQEILQKENVHLLGLLFIVSFRYTHNMLKMEQSLGLLFFLIIYVHTLLSKKEKSHNRILGPITLLLCKYMLIIVTKQVSTTSLILIYVRGPGPYLHFVGLFHLWRQACRVKKVIKGTQRNSSELI